MSRIFYAWELGDNFGHVGSFRLLGRLLRSRGHAVHLEVARADDAARVLQGEDFDWVQAPVCAETARPGPPLSYSDMLLRFGYADAAQLRVLVKAWRERLLQTGADLVLADHAPTAILAARTLGIPVMLFSSGFGVPPRQRPLPNMRPWLALPAGVLETVENQALASINVVLAGFGLAPLAGVADLFDVAEDTLKGYPELDHYADRGPARYWGNLPDAGVGAPPPWPAFPGKRIFAYLRPALRHLEAAFSAIHALRQPAVVVFPDAPRALIDRYRAAHLVVSATPVNLIQAAREADAAVTYASMNTTTSFLLSGKPVLMLPGHLEQYLLSRRVEEMGAGLLVHPEQPAKDLPHKLRRILFDADFSSNARAFADKYAAFDNAAVSSHLVRRIEEITAGAGSISGQRT